MHAALLSGDQQDQLVIAYNLIMDNKRLVDETEKLQILDFFVASSPPVESFMMVGLFGFSVVDAALAVLQCVYSELFLFSCL